jgi:hypothetical protein
MRWKLARAAKTDKAASLGIKVIDVREADEYEIAKVDGVPLLP